MFGLLPGFVVSPGMFSAESRGMEYLGGNQITADSASITVTIPVRDALILIASITGMAATGIPAVRFNADSAANYWDRNFRSPDVAGQATFANTQTASSTMIRMHQAGELTAAGRAIFALVTNRQATTKVLLGQDAASTGSAGTIGSLNLATGEWVNTTAQITSVTILEAGGANILSGSALSVFGRDFP